MAIIICASAMTTKQVLLLAASVRVSAGLFVYTSVHAKTEKNYQSEIDVTWQEYCYGEPISGWVIVIVEIIDFNL